MKPIKFGLIACLLVATLVVLYSEVAFATVAASITADTTTFPGEIDYEVTNTAGSTENITVVEIVTICATMIIENTPVGWFSAVEQSGNISGFTAGQTVTRWYVDTSPGILPDASLNGFRHSGGDCPTGTLDWGVEGASAGTDGGTTTSFLPVTFSYFTVKSAPKKGVLLRWRTETEINNAGFAVYRSESAEGSYTKIAFVKGAGTSAMPNDYQYIDKKVDTGRTYFYYLKDLDNTGTGEKTGTIGSTVPQIQKSTAATTWGMMKKRL